jgi:DNA-directed RNA polymerase subunit alpha
MIYRNWTELVKPKRIVRDKSEKDVNKYGKFVIEPLERGFGLTLGNALRRVLLSSLQGAAIVDAKFEGVTNEFESIAGVKESFAEIILNLKQVHLHLEDKESVMVTLHEKGPKVVTAGDIQEVSGLTVLNKDKVIATLDEDGELNAIMTVKLGKGYVPAEEQKEDLPIGTIAIDAIFSPILKVTYNVSNARIGEKTDYDKLTLEITTKGGVKPEDALAFAAKILQDQLSIFINFDEAALDIPVEDESEPKDEKPSYFKHLYRSFDELELTVRASNCLRKADIKLIGELVQKTEAEMLATKNFGRKSLNEIKDVLKDMGLTLGMNIPEFDPEKVLGKKKEEGVNNEA